MKRFWLSLWVLPVISLGGICAAATSAFASGFALTEQSVTGLGNAFSGGAATADDASTIFFNPAGLTRLPGNSSVSAGYAIFPTVRFRNEGSTIVTGAPLLGGNGGEAGVDSLISNFYTAISLSDRLKIGLGVNPPFGLAVIYKNDWVGRYQAVESRLATVNINPTIAAKLTDNFSVGAGLNVQYAAAVLSNAIDFGLIGRQAGLRTLPQQADGFVKVSGKDWSVGYNLGVLYEPTPTTRIGLAYRSKITHELKGDADFTVPDVASRLTARGQFKDTDASASLKLPDSLSLSAYHQISQQWAIMGDVTWTNWSRFQELRIKFDNPAQPDSVQPENWKDTVRVGVGVNYTVNNALTLRAGVALDPSPVRDEFNTPRLPGGDRTWLSVGASYRPSPSLSLDVGYAHVFADDSPINQSSATAGNLRGTISSHVDIVGVQVNYNF